MLRTGCLALWVCVSACGGGDDDAPLPSAAPTPAPAAVPSPAPGTTLPPPAAAVSIDSAASGNPVSLRVVRSANGDGFAVWRAHDGTRHNLWANRYRAAAATWGSPVNIEASSADIDEFDLTVDASGNAVVVWYEWATAGDPQLEHGGMMSVRFDAGTGAWAMPVLLSSSGSEPRSKRFS
jgi:hypothetical protein